MDPLKPSAVLDAEHRKIRHLLDAMDGMATRLDRGEPVPKADVDSALDMAVGYGTECHEAKEEKILFGALRDLGTLEALRIVDELEADHVAAQRLERTMRAESGAGESRDPVMMGQLARDVRAYTKLLRTHIDHETLELLPLTDRLHHLASERVARAFERLDVEEVGEGRHARFERTIDGLHERYAPKGSSSSVASHAH